MKKKIYIICGVIGVLLLAGFIYVVNVGNAIKQGAPHISETINESKEIKAFVAEYKIDTLSPGLNDSLIKYGLEKVELSDLEYWIEKVWGIDYKYVFFEEINFGNSFRLHITDPTSLRTQEQVFPFIGFKLKNTSQDSGENGKGGIVCILNIDSIPQSINLEIYLSLDHSTDKKIGDIILGLATNCSSNQKLRSVSKVISDNKTREIKVIPLDDLYINWLNTIVEKNNHWDWSLRINDNGNIKEYYSDLIYFTGALDASGNKTGTWDGYYGNKLIIKTSYPGSINNNSPMYVKLWDPAGRLLKEMNFSIIN